MSDRNLVILFFAVLLVTMVFYGLGLLLGRTDLERTTVTVSQPPATALKSKASALDPRSELDFINTVSPKIQSPQSAVSSEVRNGAATGTRAAAHETFSVQVGAFERKPDARKVLEALIREGYSVRIVAPSDSPNDSQFLVYVGQYSDRGDAEAAARQLDNMGFPGLVKVEPAQPRQ